MCKVIKLKLFLFVFLLSSKVFTQNKIVYLISPPRCSSTAFVRMIHAREDFIVMNEPCLHARNPNMNKNWFYEDAPRTFDEVKQNILIASKTSNVFIKDMSFSVKDFLLRDEDFVQNENIYFVFLVRNPHHSLLSLYKKILRDFCSLSRITPYRDLYDILMYIKKQSPNKPIIILSENLYENASETIKSFCSSVGIEHKESALSWENLGDDFTGKNEWNEIKHKDLTYHWHGDAIKSVCFATPHIYLTDQEGLPTFEEIPNEKDREHCKKIYYANFTYYNLILDQM